MMHNRISNRDIMKTMLDELFTFDGQMVKAEAMYSDPPWGLGNLKYWRTMNGQKGEAEYQTAWIEFLERLKAIRDRHVDGPTFIETGMRFEKDLAGVFGKPSRVYRIVYTSKKLPNLLMCWGDLPSIDVTGKSGVIVALCTLRSLPHVPKSVLDPCVGLGITAKACKHIEATCFANELNRSRMIRTAKIMDFEEV
jgi:hypothetical protein